MDKVSVTSAGRNQAGGVASRHQAQVAVALLAVSVTLVVADLALFAADLSQPSGRSRGDVAPRLIFPVIALASAGVGALVISRIWRSFIGRLFCAVGLVEALGCLAWEYGIRATIVEPGSLPAGDWVYWVGNWLPFVMIPAVPLLLLSFPDLLPGRRWRVFRGLAIAGVPLFLLGDMNSRLPAGARSLHGLLDAIDAPLTVVGQVVLVVAAVSSLVSMGLKTWRAESEQRHQLKWLAMAGIMVVLALLDSVLGNRVVSGPAGDVIGSVLFLAAFTSIPLAVGVAVLKYRLYDIDVVISRALLYGALVAFITAVYVAIVAGFGALAGGGGRPSLVLSIVATAVVAVAFQPVRERLQKLANRLVYGRRATPYEVLAEFSARVAGGFAGALALPQMAQVLAEGTAAARAEVWVRAGARMSPAAAWPPTKGGRAAAVACTGQLLPQLPSVDRAVAVRHQGELLGALTVTKRPGETLTPIEVKLLEDLAHQAGLLLKNFGLTADLEARLRDLGASRQRVVAAQDQERRRLERDLHDGAQQHLVAIKVKLGLAEMLAPRDPQRARATLAELKNDADEALETLRDLARGIYPPLLADKGLVAALEAQARKATLPVTVSGPNSARYPRDVEAAVYFCCLEGLQNIQKYSGATNAAVRLEETRGQVTFAVSDDGRGFDVAGTRRGSGLQNIEDRLDALGGTLSVTSAPGRGTTLRGSLPVLAAVDQSL